MFAYISLFSLLSLLPLAQAHGYVRQLVINGTVYRGNIPKGSNFPSPIRAITDPSPVHGATNPSINCGTGSTPAAFVAPAMPGDAVTFDWAGGDNGPWPHNTGPVITYLASCGNSTADKFDSTTAKWFKIDEVGKDDNGTWFQQAIMNGNTITTHLPVNLAPGHYIMRHEIIALHLAGNPGGAEFYPSCSQLVVGGTETGMPKPENTVAFPGAYSDTDPGILDPNVFTPGANYTFPGPAIDPSLDSDGSAITEPAPSTTGLPDPSLTATPASTMSTAAQLPITTPSNAATTTASPSGMPSSSSSSDETTYTVTAIVTVISIVPQATLPPTQASDPNALNASGSNASPSTTNVPLQPSPSPTPIADQNGSPFTILYGSDASPSPSSSGTAVNALASPSSSSISPTPSSTPSSDSSDGTTIPADPLNYAGPPSSGSETTMGYRPRRLSRIMLREMKRFGY